MPDPAPSAHPPAGETPPAVTLVRGGLQVGEQLVPLHAGAVHYWRLSPKRWRECLLATKSLGVRLIDLYVPWNVHEIAPGMLELGKRDAQRDVGRFLDLIQELDLLAIVRPGPHINAELTYFGIPERVVWDESCQARSATGAPVVLPMVPMAFPVPSYASNAFFDEVGRFFDQLAPVIKPRIWPNGPIVMLQIDNEGAMYFRDGVYDQDYHPDAIALYRDFLREHYRDAGSLTEAYRDASSDEGAPAEELKFSTVEPPTAPGPQEFPGLLRHIDWAAFQEHLLAHSFRRFGDALVRAGICGVPTMHNLPLGYEVTPLNSSQVAQTVDLVGMDFYHPASEIQRRLIARRTTQLTARCDAVGHPAFACEMGAGFPPFFPPLEESDSEFATLCAMAYGLRGLNIYMAVERDRWIGAPIDADGNRRPFAQFWTQLFEVLNRVHFASLQLPLPVRLVVPRSDRRLARALHAYGPFPASAFAISGGGPRETVLEDLHGYGVHEAMIAADEFLRAIELALEARGVSFAHVGGEDRDTALDGAKWLICPTTFALRPSLLACLGEQAERGVAVSFGPADTLKLGRKAHGDLAASAGMFEADPTSAIAKIADTQDQNRAPTLIDAAEIEPVVDAAIAALSIPTAQCSVAEIHLSVHVDGDGTPRILFVINATDVAHDARLHLDPRISRATDCFTDDAFEVAGGAFELTVAAKSVRMLALG